MKKILSGIAVSAALCGCCTDLETKGSVGFQGMHGGARPYFRNIRISRKSK